MKIQLIDIQPYQRTFASPLVTSYGAITERQGFILTLKTEEGFIGKGEAAPLPGYSKTPLSAVGENLENIKKRLTGAITPHNADEIMQCVSDESHGDNFSAFALETALCDIAAQMNDLPLCQWLNPDARLEVPVNVLINRPVKDWQELVSDIKSRGYKSVKIKVGSDNYRGDAKFVDKAAAALGPGIAIRLDANRAWDQATALKFADLVRDVAIEYIEEPMKNAKAMQSFRDACSIPVALDETLVSNDEIMEHLIEDLCDVVILKPAVMGGLLATLDMNATILSYGKKAVITSLLETEIGLAAQLHLAAALPAAPPPCGFDTLRLFSQFDPVLALVSDGCLTTPTGKGLGRA